MLRERFLAEVTEARRACDYSTAADLIRAYQAAHPESPDPHVESGHIAFDRERYDLAADYFDQALALDPSDERALAWKVALLNVNDHPAAAIEFAERLLVDFSLSAAIRVALGRTKQSQGRKEEALAEYEEALRVAPDHLDAVEWRIEVIGRLHGYDAALAEVEPAVKRFPQAPELCVAAYPVTRGSQETGRAQDMLDRALKIHPACVPPLRMKINWLVSTGRFDEAVARADEGLVLAPAAADLHVARGRALYRQGRFTAAIECFRGASELEPYKVSGLTWLRAVLKQLDRYDEAEAVIDEALRRMPNNVSLLTDAAKDQKRKGNHGEALALTGKAVHGAPTNSKAVCSHLSTLVDQHRYAEAEQVALAALQHSPEKAAVAAKLASVHETQDHDEEALAWYRKASELAPSPNRTADVANTLGYLNRFDEAGSLLVRAIEAEPESAELQRQLSLLRVQQGDLEGALVACRRAVELKPVDVNVRTTQIDLLCRFRRFDDAEAAALAAVDLLPGNGRIRAARSWPLSQRGQEAEAEAVLRTALQECEDVWPIRLNLLGNLSGQGRFDEALQEAEQMLGQDPHDITAHWWKVDLLADTHRYDKAVRHSERVIDLHPASIRLRLQLGWLLHDTGDFDGALVEFESVCAMLPTIGAVRSRAKTLCRLRRFGEAETVLLEEIRKKPHYAILRHELAWTYWIQAKHKQALVECERARQVEFGPVPGIVNHVVILRGLNRWEDSERILGEAIPRYPDSPLLPTQMGLLRDDQNRYSEALEWFDRALEIDSRHTRTLVAKSATLRSLGRFGEAETTLAPALARLPASSELLVERGWIFRDQGQLSRAKQIFTEVADKAPSPGVRADARRCLGWTVFSEGRYELARDLFREALAENANFTEAKIGLAWSLVRLDDPENDQKAEQLCLDILTTDPRNHLAHTCAGVLYSRQRDFQLAEHHLRHSLELDPFDGSFVDLAVLLTDLERFDEAEQLLSKALDRNWYDIQAHIEFGRLHLQRDIDSGEIGDDARRAGVHFRQALTLDPASSAAATGLAVTLSRLPGDLTEAERVVRRVIGRAEQSRDRWPLLLTLARLLIGRGDADQRPELYLEALALAQEAIDLASQEAEPYFVAGIAAFKAGSQNTDVRLVSLYRRRSVRYLRRCLERDNRHEEARRAMTLAEQSVAVAGGSLAGSRALTWITALLLAGLWTGFFLTDKISAVVLGTMTVVLAGLFALGFVLPHLVRLKLPGGVEADLSASLAQVSAGPTGELSIGRGRFAGTNSHFEGLSSLNTGPRGELPRLGAGPEEPLV